MVVEYRVLKNGQVEGPFSEGEVVQHLQSGRYGPHDLAQTQESAHWTPLRKFFEIEVSAGAYEPVPEWMRKVIDLQGLITLAASTSRAVFLRDPLATGVLCLGIGCAIVVLSRIAPLLYLPWIVIALIAGGVLMVRGKVFSGVLLCLAAVLIPVLVIVATWKVTAFLAR